MICPKCQAEGRTSDVVEIYRISRVADNAEHVDAPPAQGRHYHNPNVTITISECERGHQVVAEARRPCPNINCSYGKSEP